MSKDEVRNKVKTNMKLDNKGQMNLRKTSGVSQCQKNQGKTSKTQMNYGKSDKSQMDYKKMDKSRTDYKKMDKFRKHQVQRDVSENGDESVNNPHANKGEKGKFVCPVYKKCGGCQYQGKSYAWQLKEKEKQVAKLLKPFCTVKPIIGMENPYYYRNKVHAVFDRDRRGNIISGVYEAGTHHVVPVDSCLIEDQQADKIIVTIRSLLKSFKIKTYDEDTQYGLLRHVLIRKGFTTGEIMVVLVTASPVFPSKNNFVKALLKVHPEITTIIQNVNNRGDSMVLGKTDKTLYGKGYIEDKLYGCTFRISPQSFYQVNPAQTEILYNKAMEYAGLTGEETVIDAYCGTGTIGLIASKKAKSVVGVEMNRDAVKDAISNAKRNEVKNTRFFCGDATEFMVDMAANGERAEVVFLDPPRSGSTKECLDAVVRMGPKTVVYVSCNPETLARDLAYITKKGYKAREAVPVDCFPWTGHVETVCLLSNTQRPKKESYITLDVEMEDYYRIKNEGKNSTT